MDINLVDRIARVLFHESLTTEGMDAIAWTMFNRTYSEENFTYGKPKTLQNVLTADGGYEVFDTVYGSDVNKMFAMHPNSVIGNAELNHRWNYALDLSKTLVSITSYDNLSYDEKYEMLDSNYKNEFTSNKKTTYEYRGINNENYFGDQYDKL